MDFLKKTFKFLGSEMGLNYLFNFGSMLGFILIMQTLSGLMMTFYYTPSGFTAFESVQYMMFEVKKGWLVRLIHFNGASLFFLFLFLHFFKALFFFSYRLKEVWFLGLLVMIMIMGEAFLGYSLVWGQMSFWAATVITSLLSVIPIYGKKMVLFIWGGFNLNSNTLKLFYLIHFLLPFLILIISFFHIFFLHKYGSTTKLYMSSKHLKRTFYPFYWVKDLMNILFFLFFFMFILYKPFYLGDPLVSEELNELVSPVHIVPEWYFLWAYAILRAIPSKIMGVFTLLMSVLIYFFFLFQKDYNPKKGKLNKLIMNFFIMNCFMLTWLGGLEPVYPFVFLSLIYSFFYFLLIFMVFLTGYLK